MTQSQIHAFIPCRAGSVRVPNKNTRVFAGVDGGLVSIKLEQLADARRVDQITVSTDDPIVMDAAEKMRPRIGDRLHVIGRPAELAISDSLDAFVAYIPSIVTEGVLMWMHVTSPFFGAAAMDRAVLAYQDNVATGPYDSLMGVTKIQSFVWDDTGCISHDRNAVKWPQTQDIKPIYDVNSTVFMIDIELMRASNDRTGVNPYLFQTNKLESFDIDWEDDFEAAQTIYGAGIGR